VDKTKDIYNLFVEGGKYYFLSRPRRFGKSLLISTLKEIFSGNKELFKGLWIYDKLEWEKHPVIHLVDEYDKPLIDFVDKQEIASENRSVLKTFFGTIKGADEYIEFVFITGVSKFSKVSVFSDLNNLRDITISGTFSTMLGYTEEE
jgi:hypothetical protein